MTTFRSWLLAGAGCAALGAFATPALGQDADPQAQESGAVVGEIVVTAQRREENLQDVPIAVTVVGGEQLAQRQVFSTESLVQLVPSLTLQKGSTNVNSSLNVRGVGTVTFSSGAEPAVSTVLDGVVLARPGQSILDLFDVERIEVLRGPQGTLFGKNASAGVVSIVTRRPSQTFRGRADLAYFEGEEYRAQVGVSGPLSDTVRGTLSGVVSEYDGNAKNVFNGEMVNGYERLGARAKLEVEPDDRTLFTFIADWQHAVDDCCGEPLNVTVDNAFTRGVLRPSLAPANPEYGNRDVDLDYGPVTKDLSWGLSGQADVELGGGFTFTSITAYREWSNTEYRDGDYRSDAPRFVFGTGAVSNETGVRDIGLLDFYQLTQEVRVASPTGGFAEYVLGGFYYTTRQENFFNRTAVRCTASTLAPTSVTVPVTPATPLGTQAVTPCSPAASTYTVVGFGNANWTTEFENYALFGQTTLNFTDRLRAIAGLRWSHDEVEYDFARVATATITGVTPSIVRTGDTQEDGLSGRLGLQYDFTDDINGYVNYARGYKGPAFNMFFNFNTQTLPGGVQVERDSIPLSKEESDSYEAGLKTRLFDRRLVLNMAAFLTEFSGFQATTFDVIGGLTVTRLINAGEVSTRGFEFDFTAVPFENFTLSGGAIFQDAKVDNFICPPQAPISCNVNGNKLPFAPEYKLTLNADYRLETGALPFDLGFNAGYTWQDEYFNDFANNPVIRQEAVGLLDATISLIDRDDRYRLSLVGKNLTDEFYTVTRVNEGAGFVRNRVPRDAERYFGVVLRANFGG
jgi:iron complex outermembrane receptor protein